MDRAFRSFLAADLLILDDLGLHRLTGQQSADLYELIVSRRRVSTFVMTSNRAVEDWLSLIDDPILDNSAPGGPANASYPDRHRGLQLPGTAVAPPEPIESK